MSGVDDESMRDLESGFDFGYKAGRKSGKRIGIIIGALIAIPIVAIFHFISMGIVYWK